MTLINRKQPDLFDAPQGAEGAVQTGLSQTFPIRAYARAPAGRGVFAKVGHHPAPSAPYKTSEIRKALENQDFASEHNASEGAEGAARQSDPAQTSETRNDRRAAFAAWEAECQRYDAEGRRDELPPLPAGYVSQGMARLQRQTREPRKWR